MTKDKQAIDEALDLFNNPDKEDVEYWSTRAASMHTIIASLKVAQNIEGGDIYLYKVLADIREVTGVGHKPMLSELAQSIEKEINALKAAQDVEAVGVEETLEKMRHHIDDRLDFSEQPNEAAKDAYIYELYKIASRNLIRTPREEIEGLEYALRCVPEEDQDCPIIQAAKRYSEGG